MFFVWPEENYTMSPSKHCKADVKPHSMIDSIIIYFFNHAYTQMHHHVRIETAPFYPLDIKLEAHNSLEYNYMRKH